MRTETIRLQNLFQFHTGSIKGFAAFYRRALRQCFNSTLVRLKVEPVAKTVRASDVSIPHWFD